jgi:3-dehydro-L-gulonate 2-dehydrogenase
MKPDPAARTVRIPYESLRGEFCRILKGLGFQTRKAEQCATVFADNSLDGVYTHGVNRFPRFVQYVREGHVKIDTDPVRISATGGIELWDGQRGPGILNALFCTGRAMELAGRNGIGLAGLSNTNHWMRGGTYGRKAADGGCMFIGWTNTIAIMPAWEAVDCRLGNNPLVLAAPGGREPVVLDMAMSQFSFGALESYARTGVQLPVPGGVDAKGVMTADPSEILSAGRMLPIGFWKGSGMALLLDILASMITGGLSTHEISRHESEFNLSQVFIAIDPVHIPHQHSLADRLAAILQDHKGSTPLVEGTPAMIPGERVARVRRENAVLGIPVDEELWKGIVRL